MIKLHQSLKTLIGSLKAGWEIRGNNWTKVLKISAFGEHDYVVVNIVRQLVFCPILPPLPITWRALLRPCYMLKPVPTLPKTNRICCLLPSSPSRLYKSINNIVRPKATQTHEAKSTHEQGEVGVSHLTTLRRNAKTNSQFPADARRESGQAHT